MGNYSGRKAHLTSKDYLMLLDGKLGFPQGTLYDLCAAAAKSKVKVKSGVTVTYRGIVTREKYLLPHKPIQIRNSVFLIEFMITKAGKRYERVIQVHLEL